MALVSPGPSTPHRMGYSMSPMHDIGSPAMMITRREIVQELNPCGVNDTIYVAVAKDVKDSKLNLIWAIQNSGGKRIRILHVHVPAHLIPMTLGAKFPASKSTEQEVEAYRKIERQDMRKNLDAYNLICKRMGVRVEILHIEMDCIEKGIVELISLNNIQNLVMGAASDKHHSKRMRELRSKKAIYVCEHAPSSCHVQFICKGYLIHTRDHSLNRLQQQSVGHSDSEVGHSPHLRSKSVSHVQNHWAKPANPAQELFRRVRPISIISCPGQGSSMASDISDGSVSVMELNMMSGHSSIKEEDPYHSSPPSVLDAGRDDNLYDRLRQAMAEAENARCHAYQEAHRRGKAEKEAVEAMRKAKDTILLYQKEVNLRKELEEALMKAKEEIDNMRSQRDGVNKLGEGSSRDALEVFSEFSFSEIEKATCNFNSSLKIGEGGYGSIFKGILRHTVVAIKVLNPNSTQGPSEFQKEVEILTRLRHPNLITLIGSCPESGTLVYEYLPNGSLEDRLSCKNNTSPLPWQTRIRIAAELCSALIFLHSSKPHSIVHGDLKPSNILLDGNLVSKLSDFGICRILYCQEDSNKNSTQFWITDVPKGTFAYMDPEFLASGELTSKSDVYSFGIVLLRLITGRPALGIKNEVMCAINAGKIKSLLDPLAGEWPIVLAEELFCLALRCCDMNRMNRPELCNDVWRVLEPMGASCGGTNTFDLSSQGHCQTPSSFICPISQEVTLDPHVAADGFT